MKKSILTLLSILLLTISNGCAERGAIVNIPTHPTTYKVLDNKVLNKKKSSIPTLILRAPKEDEVKNNISGGLILIIGLLLIL